MGRRHYAFARAGGLAQGGPLRPAPRAPVDHRHRRHRQADDLRAGGAPLLSAGAALSRRQDLARRPRAPRLRDRMGQPCACQRERPDAYHGKKHRGRPRHRPRRPFYPVALRRTRPLPGRTEDADQVPDDQQLYGCRQTAVRRRARGLPGPDTGNPPGRRPSRRQAQTPTAENGARAVPAPQATTPKRRKETATGPSPHPPTNCQKTRCARLGMRWSRVSWTRRSPRIC